MLSSDNMPLIATFGGGSVRAFGRGLEQFAEAVVPANAVIPFNVADITTATIPSGWSQFNKFNGKFVIGTATNADIGTSLSATGNVSVAFTMTSNGHHAASGANTGLALSPDNTTGGDRLAGSSNGAHTHTGGFLNVSGAMPNTVMTPYLKATAELETLPPNSIVFRRDTPTSVSFTGYQPSGNGYFYGGSTSSWTDRRGTGTGTGETGANGAHNHTSTSISYRATTFNAGSPAAYAHATEGDHTHPFTTALNAQLKSKHLKAWVSGADEAIEPGMILMYDGNLGDLPAGWRVCNGLLGTPDMVDYFIGYGSGLSHDQVIHASSNVFTTGTTTVQSVDWTHDHIGTQTNYYGSAQLHGSLSVPHTHTVSNTTVMSVITQYMPNCTKIAFIQYKSI